MNEIRLLFGRPVIRDRKEFISALRELQSRSGCIIQAFDARKVASERHLIFAAEKALQAFSEGRNIAKDPGVEILRYASGERQIERALSKGISATTERIALMMLKTEEDGCSWPKISEISDLMEIDGEGPSFDPASIMEAFGITDSEIEAAGENRIADLVIERVALVDTYK